MTNLAGRGICFGSGGHQGQENPWGVTGALIWSESKWESLMRRWLCSFIVTWGRPRSSLDVKRASGHLSRVSSSISEQVSLFWCQNSLFFSFHHTGATRHNLERCGWFSFTGLFPIPVWKSMLTHNLVLEKMASQNSWPEHGLTLCQKSLSTNQYVFRVFHWLNLLLAEVNICKRFATVWWHVCRGSPPLSSCTGLLGHCTLVNQCPRCSTGKNPLWCVHIHLSSTMTSFKWWQNQNQSFMH